jgi:hypothetical protein
MSEALKTTLCDHAAGNYRTLTTMAGNLLTVAVEKNLTQLDEKLYFEVFAPNNCKPRRVGEGLWSTEVVGIIGGETKCEKSLLALDLAVAVAYGTPCLRRFPTRQSGPCCSLCLGPLSSLHPGDRHNLYDLDPPTRRHL